MTTSAVPARRRKAVAVEWVYIRYRTLLFIAAAVLAVVAAGLWWWSSARPVVTVDQARAAVEAASTAVAHARQVAGDAPMLPEAEGRLDAARRELDAMEFAPALDDARAAEGLARDLIENRPRPDQASVRFVKVDGDVRVKRAGEFLWDTASEHDQLHSGDQIRTGSGATAQLMYLDGTRMVISPGTLLEIREVVRDPSRRIQRVSEQLAYGGVSAQTQASEGYSSIHRVSTEQSDVTAHDAAEFQVSYDRERQTQDIVSQRGDIVVQTGGTDVPLAENTRVRVAGGKVVEKVRLLEPPTLLAPADQKGYPPGATVTLAWGPVEHATGYLVQIGQRPVAGEGGATEHRLETTEMPLPTVSIGTYYWRVVALDAAGREGRWADWYKFRVLSGELADPDDRTPPSLTVSEIMVVGSNAIVTGRSDPGSIVWVDGERVDVDDDGRFTALVKLREDGENKIKFVAQDAAGNESRRIGTAFLDAY